VALGAAALAAPFAYCVVEFMLNGGKGQEGAAALPPYFRLTQAPPPSSACAPTGMSLQGLPHRDNFPVGLSLQRLGSAFASAVKLYDIQAGEVFVFLCAPDLRHNFSACGAVMAA
jgi:hypothetical protein